MPTIILNAQLSITGPECVRSGEKYTYVLVTDTLEGEFNACVQNGVISDTSLTCVADSFIRQVTVIWNEGSQNGLITLSVLSHSATLSTSIIPDFSAGLIDSSIKTQIVSADSLPSNIVVSFPSGGACNPVYEYQWEKSTDHLNWEEIVGASGQVLTFQSPVTTATFFRRKVTETTSGNISYTDAAVVYIDIPEND